MGIIVINPDGTISEAQYSHNQDGSISKIWYSDELNRSTSSSNNFFTRKTAERSYSTTSYSRTKKKRKKGKQQVAPTKVDAEGENVSTSVKKDSTTTIQVPVTGSIATKSEIDSFLANKKKPKRIYPCDYGPIVNRITDIHLIDYFCRRCFELGIKIMSDKKKSQKTSKESKKQNSQKTKKAKNPAKTKGKSNEKVQEQKQTLNIKQHSNKSIWSNAKMSDEAKTTMGKMITVASRKPKYGYARDRFGRVQKGDMFDEERTNEFRQAQNWQNHYDYSSYDANDDNDGAYNTWD